MANKKKTQKEFFEDIIEVVKTQDRDDLVDFCKDRIEKLNNKSGANKKPTKTQIANETIKDTLVTIIEELDNPVTVSEILMDSRIEVGTSNQKITSLLTQLKEEHRIDNFKDKGKSYYTKMA